MQRFLKWRALLLLAGVLTLPVLHSWADTLEMKDSRFIRGKYLGGTQSQIRFLVDGKVRLYPIEEVVVLTLGGDTKPTVNKSQNHSSREQGDVADAGAKSPPAVDSLARKDLSVNHGKSRTGVPPWGEPYLDFAYLRKAWETSGRDWMYKYSGVKWNAGAQRWDIDSQWPDRTTQVGPQAYYLEYTARGAVNMGALCNDTKLLDELSGFYVVYANRFTTLGEMRYLQSAGFDTKALMGQGADSARTLIEIDNEDGKGQVLECALCNSQFFHPASRLLRVITLLPESKRTPLMKDFARLYTPLIVRDHLIRLLYEAQWDYWGAEELPKQLVTIWKTIRNTSARPQLSYQHGMHDWDLWLIATTAEILGANANDPTLVPLGQVEKARLLQAVAAGVSLFQKKGTFYPNTKNFRGTLVGSASYFDGDFAEHPDYEYAGYTGESFPTKKNKRPYGGVSWDISHFYRVPVFLRSLYDTRKATNVDFPSARHLELIANQYVYKVFRGDFNRPLFNNFFDGGNGWFRVNYEGTTGGHPPAQYCDARNDERPCLIVGALFGWGLIASFHPDLMELQHALLRIAWTTDREKRRFKDRYYFYDGQTFAFRDEQGRFQYPILLFWLLSGVPEKLPGCGS